MISFKEGYDFFEKNASAFTGAHAGDEYISSVNKEISDLTVDMNSFQGFDTKVSALKGDVAEFWHSGTHNIDAAVKGVDIRTTVNRSHDFASADITSSDGTLYGLKYYKSGAESAKAQSESVFQRYAEYKAEAINVNRPFQTLDEFIQKRGYTDTKVLNDPIYSGQVRIIPRDQMQDAIEWLERKIQKESISRPDQVQRYQDTLNLLKDRISSSEGSQSIPLSKDEAEVLAQLSKDGEFDPSKYGLTTEELVKYKYVIQQAFKAGLTAATISMILKVAPEIYKAIDYLICNGELDEKQFKKIGFAALQGGSEGFVRGAVSAAITTACKAGLWGNALKTVSQTVIGTVTVLVMDVMKNAFSVTTGKMTKGELVDSLIRDMYVSSCSLILGGITQSIIEIPVLGFMLGSFVGSVIGSFAYSTSYKTYISFCIETGFTMFGIVDQNYTLPDDILKEIGLAVFEYDTFEPITFEPITFEPITFDPITFKYDTIGITVLRRGVIGVNQIGYII